MDGKDIDSDNQVAFMDSFIIVAVYTVSPAILCYYKCPNSVPLMHRWTEVKKMRLLSTQPCAVIHGSQPHVARRRQVVSFHQVGGRWMEYQGKANWEGLLDPLDDNLRSEILRYGHFAQAAYTSFDFTPSSPSFATCLYPKSSFFDRCGLPGTGYRVTKYLRATSGIQLPRWAPRSSWLDAQSSWIGYVAVCDKKERIAELGRRDVVISFRGTATGLEWLENLRATLAPLPTGAHLGCMVETGFLSLYTSRNHSYPSLQDMVRDQISRLLKSYGGEPLSLTITGHSLGAALATLAAYDIKTTFKRAPMVTVISFGGPRVGNRSFRCHLEKHDTKVLRIVNADDVITKVPGFLIASDRPVLRHNRNVRYLESGLATWIRKRVEDTEWAYAEVGRELRLSSKNSPRFSRINVATCHDLNTYLHLVNDFQSSTCSLRATAKRILASHKHSSVKTLRVSGFLSK